ncbi:MAG TPA: hypothetical protein VII45_13650 [Solirubrobacterales bacterium]
MSGDSGADLRRDTEDFSRALADLRAPVEHACQENEAWQAKVSASIYAALDFATANPAAARGLTIDRVARQLDGGRTYQKMIARFADLLDAVTPGGEHLPTFSNVALVAGIAKVIGDHMRSPRVNRLDDIGPELVQFALLPYLGFEEAKRWAERPVPRI